MNRPAYVSVKSNARDPRRGCGGSSLRAHRETLIRLAAVYKKVNAAFGDFAIDALTTSTRALASGSGNGDAMYTSIQGAISQLTGERDAISPQIKQLLNGSAFNGHALNEQQAKQLIAQAESLLERSHELATP